MAGPHRFGAGWFGYRGPVDRRGLLDLLATQIADRRVLDAMASVPREKFLPRPEEQHAWENRPLPIGHGQTISQPLVVARMCELLDLKGHEMTLDVGGGSGYHAAVLARLSRSVISIERHPELVESARESLAAIGAANVEVVCGDGSLGYPEAAPFDTINVAAAVHGEVPPELGAQLAEGGRMVVPVGGFDQRLELWRRQAGELSRKRLDPVAFVPLVE